MVFETDTLKIVPLTLEQVCCYNFQPEKVIDELQVKNVSLFNPPVLQTLNQNFILPRLKMAAPEEQPFKTKWLAIDKTNQLIVADFIIKSGPDEDGEIEIGYGIYPEFEGQGIMTKVLACFLQWAKQQKKVKRVVAETEKNNIGSIRVLEKNGFSLMRETDLHYYWQIGTL